MGAKADDVTDPTGAFLYALALSLRRIHKPIHTLEAEGLGLTDTIQEILADMSAPQQRFDEARQLTERLRVLLRFLKQQGIS